MLPPTSQYLVGFAQVHVGVSTYVSAAISYENYQCVLGSQKCQIGLFYYKDENDCFCFERRFVSNKHSTAFFLIC